MSDPISNPVGFLQEFCLKSDNCALPKYIETENYTSEEPDDRFICECLYDDYKEKGCGRNKKLAKYNAAKNMYSVLKEKDYFTNYDLPRQSNQGQDTENNSQEITSNPENFKGKNPISILQENCQSKGYSMPNYIGRSMGRSFNCECIVLDNKTFGDGPTIKCAKTEAAGKMCVKLGILDGWSCEAFVVQPPGLEAINGKNPISALQELCVGATLPDPVYQANGRFQNLFVVVCNVGGISGEGTYTTKKGAKVLAAQKVLTQLHQQTVSVNSGIKAVDKREGVGAHNWGSHREAIDDVENLNRTTDDSGDWDQKVDNEVSVTETPTETKEERGERRFDRERRPAAEGDGPREGGRGRPPGAGRGMGRGRGRGGRGGYDGRGKREFDRQSGSDQTGIKAVDKREGVGAHNWGSHREAIDDVENLNQLTDDSGDWDQKVDNEVSVTETPTETKEERVERRFDRERRPAGEGDGPREGGRGRPPGAGRGMDRGQGRGGRGGYDGWGKREFDRQSGSDKTGIKAVDKREGVGAHNWGSHRKAIDDVENLNRTTDDFGDWDEKVDNEVSVSKTPTETNDVENLNRTTDDSGDWDEKVDNEVSVTETPTETKFYKGTHITRSQFHEKFMEIFSGWP